MPWGVLKHFADRARGKAISSRVDVEAAIGTDRAQFRRIQVAMQPQGTFSIQRDGGVPPVQPAVGLGISDQASSIETTHRSERTNPKTPVGGRRQRQHVARQLLMRGRLPTNEMQSIETVELGAGSEPEVAVRSLCQRTDPRQRAAFLLIPFRVEVLMQGQ